MDYLDVEAFSFWPRKKDVAKDVASDIASFAELMREHVQLTIDYIVAEGDVAVKLAVSALNNQFDKWKPRFMETYKADTLFAYLKEHITAHNTLVQEYNRSESPGERADLFEKLTKVNTPEIARALMIMVVEENPRVVVEDPDGRGMIYSASVELILRDRWNGYIDCIKKFIEVVMESSEACLDTGTALGKLLTDMVHTRRLGKTKVITSTKLPSEFWAYPFV